MRLIDADALGEHLKSYAGMFTDELGFVVSLDAVLRGIDFQPTIDAEPVKHGRWMERQIQGRYRSNTYYECSVCCQIADEYKSPYCRHCGAKMDKEGE